MTRKISKFRKLWIAAKSATGEPAYVITIPKDLTSSFLNHILFIHKSGNGLIIEKSGGHLNAEVLNSDVPWYDESAIKI